MASTGLLGINPYRGGNVAIDITSKPLQTFLQIKQRKDAQAEATEKYFKDYEKSLNPAGLGAEEVKIFANKLKQVQEFGLKNKQAINNPSKYGYDAQSELMAGFKDLQTFVEESKKATAERKALVDFFNQNKKSGKQVSDDYLEVYKNAFLPVGAGYVAPDYSKIAVYEPHDDLVFSDKTWKGISLPGKIEVEEQVFNGKPTGRVKEVKVESITPEVANTYSQRVRGYFRDNLGTQEQYSNLIKDKDFVNQLNPAYKKYFGVDIKSPQDLAVAYGLATKQPKREDKTGYDFTKEWYHNETQKNANYRAALKRAAVNTGSSEENANLFDAIPDVTTVSGGSIKDGRAFDKNGNAYSGKMIIQKQNLPSEIFSAIGPLSKGVKEFEVTFENGTPVKFVNPKTGVIDRRGMYNYQLKYNTEPKKGPQPDYGGAPKSVLYILNGRKYNIPSDQVNDFLKDNPKAKKG
jgi:hypothetical protein